MRFLNMLPPINLLCALLVSLPTYSDNFSSIISEEFQKMFVVVHFVHYRNQGTDFDHTSHVLINSFLAISIKFRRMKGEKNLRWKQRYSKVCIIARLAFRKIFVLHETLFERGFSKFKLFESFRNFSKLFEIQTEKLRNGGAPFKISQWWWLRNSHGGSGVWPAAPMSGFKKRTSIILFS